MLIQYKCYSIKKPNSNSIRFIEEPCEELRKEQELILQWLNKAIKLPTCVNGITGTSIITNAIPHQSFKFILKIDLKDFYSTVDKNKIIPILNNIDFPFDINLVLYKDRLPTGASTSPILANLSFVETDNKILDLIKDKNITYTRYVDDLTFSSNYIYPIYNHLFIKNIYRLINQAGFRINYKKTQRLGNNITHEITGVTVNEQVNLSKTKKLRLRARLDHAARSGQLDQSLTGYLAYVKSISNSLYDKYLMYYNKRLSFYNK